MIVGPIIGSGTFISPRLVVKLTDNLGLAILVWLLCGVVSFLGALCYCELGCTFRKAGGEYLYILETYGHIQAFVCNWIMTTIIHPGVIAIVLLTFGTYIVQPFYVDCKGETLMASKLLSGFMTCLIALMNCWGNSLATRA